MIAYLASQYPKISHTFIEREISALRRSGTRVDTFTIRATPQTELFSPADREADGTTTSLLPLRAAMVWRALAAPALRSPLAFLGALRATLATATPGLRAHLWRLFYFVEGMILWRHTADRGISHIHVHFANAGSDVARAATEFGRRRGGRGARSWSFTMHGCTEFYDIGFFQLSEKVESAAFVACVSDFTRSQLLRIVGEEHWPKTHVVRCSVDARTYRPVPPRAAGDAPAGDEPVVLFVGRFVVEKGLPVLIETATELQRRGVRFRMRLVGDGDLREALEKRIAERGLTPVVEIVGTVGQDQMPAQYHRSDIFCMTSFGEGLPVVLMEALACELAVVAPAISGIPELVEHEVTGLLVPPARADLLADAIERLVTDPGLCERLGRTGRERVLSLHDPVDSARAMQLLFDAVTDG